MIEILATAELLLSGPNCLPYVTDSGQIVVICRQPAAVDDRGTGRDVAEADCPEGSRDCFPSDMVGTGWASVSRLVELPLV